MSFRSFVTAPIFNLALPTYPPIFHLHHRFWLMSGLGELFTRSRIFFFSFSFCCCYCATKTAAAQWTASIEMILSIRQNCRPSILPTYLNVIFKKLHHRHRRPFPLLFSWPLGVCAGQHPLMMSLFQRVRQHITQSPGRAVEGRRARTSRFSFKKKDTTFYAMRLWFKFF